MNKKEVNKIHKKMKKKKKDLKKKSTRISKEHKAKQKAVKVKENSKIFELEKNTIVGTYQKSRNFGFVIPDDKKLGSDIYISKKDARKAKNNQKVVVEIIKLPQKDKSAEGKIVEIIGYIDQAGVDMLSLVKEYDLP